MNENRRKGIKSLHLLCISILAMLLAAVPTEKLRAAEIVQETATTTGFAYEDRMLKFYKEEFAKAAILNDNYQEQCVGTEAKYYVYTAKQDVDVTFEITDISSFKMDVESYISWSGGYCIEAYDKEKVFLRKGESLYIRVQGGSNYYSEEEVANATYKVKVSATPAKAIKSMRFLSELRMQGYVECEDAFDSKSLVLGTKVEFTYTDSSKETKTVGRDFSWKVDVKPVATAVGNYPFYLYYRDIPLKLVYRLDSIEASVNFTPIKEGMEVQVADSTGGYIGYSFIPDATGYYNMFVDAPSGYELLITEDGGRVLKDQIHVTDHNDQKKLYMLKGVEYKIYVQKGNNGVWMSFWMKKGLEDIPEEFEVETVQAQRYAGGAAICPKPSIKINGENLSDLYLDYSYARNQNPGEALVIIKYSNFSVNGKYFYGILYVPFQICAETDAAKTENTNENIKAGQENSAMDTFSNKTGKIASLKSKTKKKMTIKIAKMADAKGYEISYSTDKNFKKNVKKKTTKKTTLTIKKLKRKKTYYVRVRAYRKAGGKKLYSKYSPVRKVKIK